MEEKKTITEQSNQKSLRIDEMSSLEIITLMAEGDKKIYEAIEKTLPTVAKSVDAIVERWQKGGRCFVVGAGTSGRLGVLDSVELIPTFSIEPGRWIGLIAGGYEAMWTPLEENEDDEKQVVEELQGYLISANDVIIGVSASGTTPYVLSALDFGNKIGALTISISCNEKTPASKFSLFGIEAVVGPEVIRGSTRLKAGTAQKMILNMISTATMVRLGKVYQNQMVDMQLINKKLVKRAISTLMDLTNLSEFEAKDLLEQSEYHLKTAIFVALTQGSKEQAQYYLSQSNGRLKEAIHRFFNTNLK
ncbi:N-acetylmuramic acid 6-phosphate etherase [Tepidibacillus infernus]|uniref:N-acetylmuramic acid 6-phosphate etherase n=2 Tax=Tepidibacillus TaxID=1494427 RepID=A0A135L5H5_9BACI|nr:N-acetylmuramic acid 6-phosphate etherase [Tepidibacillus decaturensis]KXG44265.1 N-acetylmuramic acid 6-phosphate etherase [Tepidibacillus decaturensis]